MPASAARAPNEISPFSSVAAPLAITSIYTRAASIDGGDGTGGGGEWYFFFVLLSLVGRLNYWVLAIREGKVFGRSGGAI